MSSSHPLGPLDEATITGIINAAASAGYEDWWGRVRSSGYCAHPIHLTRTLPTGTSTIYARCENRRESVCPACSDLYALDTWHIVTGGLNPEVTATTVAVFVTLTAPSFGPVHTRRKDASTCRATPPASCTHIQPSPCTIAHAISDPNVGTPVCCACYDYEAHVVTTWWFPQLWKRYVLTLRRLIAAHTPGVRISFVKVMEMQARLAPHYHAIIRADHPGLDIATLATLTTHAAALTRLDAPTTDGTRTLRFGAQINTQPLSTADDARRTAGYLAKYVTKNITAAPLPTRIPPHSIDQLPISTHQKQLMHTLTRLAAALPDNYADMPDRLNTLGWRGHTTTKSRAYSTTMTAQKAARAAWRASRSPSKDSDATTHETEWSYERSGHRTPGHRYLAVTAALKHREQLRTAHTTTDTPPPTTS